MMPDTVGYNTNDFRNVSTNINHKLESCSNWDKSQNGLYHAANLIFFASLLIPHHTFSSSIFIGRCLMTTAYCLFILWGFELCAPDFSAWSSVFFCSSLGHVIYWCWHFRPRRIRNRLLLNLYEELFMPLGLSQELFILLTYRSIFHQLKIGEEYFNLIPAAIPMAFPSTTIYPMRLSILLTGKLRVTYENGLLHTIKPFDFIDSCEWYLTNNVFPHSSKASIPQVSIRAEESSSLLTFDSVQLRNVLATNSLLKFILGCLIGKDISTKLYDVHEKLEIKPSNPRDLHPSSLHQGGSAVVSRAMHDPWCYYVASEMTRSQSADAVHTCKQGLTRSTFWWRNETRKLWQDRYKKLLPSHRNEINSFQISSSSKNTKKLIAKLKKQGKAAVVEIQHNHSLTPGEQIIENKIRTNFFRNSIKHNTVSNLETSV